MKKKNKFIFLATLSTACLLSLASCQGAQGPKGDQGDPGINGTNGKDGENGKDGKSCLNGKGVPASSLGTDGDSYIDTETFDFYVKESGAWSKKGSLKATSEATKGEDGTSIRTGKGVPADTLGKDGDSYIDLSTFDFYVKADGTWSKEGNIKGDKGSTGASGADGKQGETAWSNTILPSEHGYVTVDVGSAVVGQEVTFTAYGNTESGTEYALDKMYISYLEDGQTKITTATSSPYKMKMVAGGFVVRAEFSSDSAVVSKNKVTDDNGSAYSSIEEAIEKGVTKISLAKEYKLSKDLTINSDKEITIDLNGFDLDSQTYTITVSGPVVFKNSKTTGEIKGTASTLIKVQDASGEGKSSRNNFSFGGVTTYSKNSASILETNNNTGASLTIDSSVAVTSNSNIAISVLSGNVAIEGKVSTATGTAVEVKGGTVSVSGAIEATGIGKAVSVAQASETVAATVKVVASNDGKASGSISATAENGTAVEVSAGSLSVEAGKVEANSGTAVKVAQSADSVSTALVSVAGGSVTTATGKAVEVSAGEVTVSSGTVSATDSGTAVDVSETVNGKKTTVTVAKDAEVSAKSGSAVTVNSGTVEVSGKVSSEGTAVEVKGGSLDVKGTVSGKDNGIKVSSGKVTVSSGTVSANSADGAAINVEKTSSSSVSVEVKGGTIENKDSNTGTSTGAAIKESTSDDQSTGSESSNIKVDDNATVEGKGYTLTLSNESVTGGTISCEDKLENITAGKSITLKVSVTENYLFEGVQLITASKTETVNSGIYDKENGTYTMIMPSYDCAVKGVFKELDKSTVVIDEKGNQYGSFETAVAQSNKDNIDHTYTLHANCSVSSAVTFSKNNVTLDLNGKTLNLNGNTLSVTGGSLSIKGSFDSKTSTISEESAFGTIKSSSVAIQVSKDAKVTVNGAQIESSGHNAIQNYAGELVINDGVVNSQEFCVLTSYVGKTTINNGNFKTKDNAVLATNGTVQANDDRGHNTITVNGGVFEGHITTKNYIACGIYACNSDTWNINGGTFNIEDGVGILARSGTVNVGSAVKINLTAKDGLEAGWVGDSGILVPAGVEIFKDTAANYPGGEPTVNNSSSYSVNSAVVEAAASIGTRKYTSLKAAYDASSKGNTITLGKDITLDDRLIINKNITLDLGGHTVKVAKNSDNDTSKTNSATNGYQVFRVDGNHNSNPVVTIKNGTIDATNITQEASDYASGDPKNECDAIAAMYGANVTIENLNVKVNSVTGACMFARSNTSDTASKKSKITIKSGIFENQTKVTYPYNSAEKAMVLNQGDQIKTESLFSVEGGTFIGNNPANGDKNASIDSFLAQGYIVEEVTEDGVTKYVVKATGSN